MPASYNEIDYIGQIHSLEVKYMKIVLYKTPNIISIFLRKIFGIKKQKI